MLIVSIPDKLDIRWCEDVKAVWNKWKNYGVTVDQFRDAVVQKSIAFSRTHRGSAWIADASEAEGVLAKAVQDFIAAEVFKAFAAAGIRHFVSIQPANALGRMSTKQYRTHMGPHGIVLLEAATLIEAKALLNKARSTAA